MSSDKTGAMRDLQTWMSVRDMYDMLEVGAVNAHNRRAALEKETER